MRWVVSQFEASLSPLLSCVLAPAESPLPVRAQSTNQTPSAGGARLLRTSFYIEDQVLGGRGVIGGGGGGGYHLDDRYIL